MNETDFLRAVAAALVASQDRLNEADSAAGDGDLGITVATIGRVLDELAPGVAGVDPPVALRQLGLAIGARASSTFGTLISLGLIGAARGPAGPDDESPVAAAARLGRAVETAISTRGKAARGAKTLLDALGPAVDAMEAVAARGGSLPEAVAEAARAASDGAEATRTMAPTIGRQAWLAGRAEGTVDPGAMAIALAFAAAADALASG